MTTTRLLHLPDGRELAWDERGPESGLPVFYFHGAPSARIEPELFRLPGLVVQHGIRLISPDRPGLGRSTFQPARTVIDWPADVIRVADELDLKRFAVLGYSGGGPYALACALEIPERLVSATTVSGTGPFEVPGVTERINRNSLQFMRMSVRRPWLADMMMRVMGFTARRFPGRMSAQATATLPPPDAELMSDPAFGAGFANLVAEAARQGPRGPRLDTALMVEPWGFDPARIEIPVRIWHGEEDRNAPVEMGRYLAEAIPNARATFLPGRAHLSLIYFHADEILREITSSFGSD